MPSPKERRSVALALKPIYQAEAATVARLAGRFGNSPSRDEAGFLAFAKSLHTPKLYDVINRAERVSKITSFRYPNAVLRHYDRLPSLKRLALQVFGRSGLQACDSSSCC